MKARLDYQKTENGKESHGRACKKWIEINPMKRSVHIITGNAIRKGVLKKAPCEICGDIKSNAHHCDYMHPLDVMWLCDDHHKEWHSKNGEGKNANIN